MIQYTRQTPQGESTTGLTRNAMLRRLKSSALASARSGATAIRMQYPCWLMPVDTFLTLSELRPHHELRAAGKLVKWDATMETVFFLSHQWTSFDRPDHSTAQLRAVQKILLRMLDGKLPKTAPNFEDALRLPSNIQVESHEWKEIVPHAHVWLDYISVPQVMTTYTELSAGGEGQTSDLMRAVNSIPAYIERSSHFLSIVPTVRAEMIVSPPRSFFYHKCFSFLVLWSTGETPRASQRGL